MLTGGRLLRFEQQVAEAWEDQQRGLNCERHHHFTRLRGPDPSRENVQAESIVGLDWDPGWQWLKQPWAHTLIFQREKLVLLHMTSHTYPSTLWVFIHTPPPARRHSPRPRSLYLMPSSSRDQLQKLLPQEILPCQPLHWSPTSFPSRCGGCGPTLRPWLIPCSCLQMSCSLQPCFISLLDYKKWSSLSCYNCVTHETGVQKTLHDNLLFGPGLIKPVLWVTFLFFNFPVARECRSKPLLLHFSFQPRIRTLVLVECFFLSPTALQWLPWIVADCMDFQFWICRT